MISEAELEVILEVPPREVMEFSIFGFLIYGWYGWILYPLIGILFSPLLLIRYSIICFSLKKGIFYTRRKIHLMSKSGLGFKWVN